MIPLLKKELKIALSAYPTYLFFVVFLSVCAVFLWIIPDTLNIFDSVYVNLRNFFTLSSWLLLWLIPALCMKTIAEERRSGTLELLLSRPFTVSQLIIGKFLAKAIIILCALLPSLLYTYTLFQLSEPVGNLDLGVILSSYIGLLLLALAFVAISIFCSAVTSHQLVAFILGTCLCFIFYIGFEYVSSLASIRPLQPFFYRLSIHEHYLTFSRGIVDSRDLVYFLSIIVMFLIGSVLTIKLHRK